MNRSERFLPNRSSIKGPRARSLSPSRTSTRKRERVRPNAVHHVPTHSYVWKIGLVSLPERSWFHSSLPTFISSRRVMILVFMSDALFRSATERKLLCAHLPYDVDHRDQVVASHVRVGRQGNDPLRQDSSTGQAGLFPAGARPNFRDIVYGPGVAGGCW